MLCSVVFISTFLFVYFRKEIMDSCVKLFNNSEQFLASVDAEDTYTALHNIRYKKIKKEMRKHDLCEHLDPSESGESKFFISTYSSLLHVSSPVIWLQCLLRILRGLLNVALISLSIKDDRYIMCVHTHVMFCSTTIVIFLKVLWTTSLHLHFVQVGNI